LTAVKICGLTTPETIDAAVKAGAQYVGFVFFPPSPRSVTPPVAAELAQHVPPGIAKVGLVVNPDNALLDEIAKVVPLDMIQVHKVAEPDRVCFDWRLLSTRRIPKTWMLAGGLTPENVAEAIALTGAKQVDVSSGVESAPGKKDIEKIGAFIRNAGVPRL